MGYGSNGRGTSTGKRSKLGDKLGTWGNATKADNDAGELDAVPGLLSAISLIVAAGDAITFSKTSGGDCWSITVLHNRVPTRRYPHDQAELDEAVSSLIELYAAEPGPA